MKTIFNLREESQVSGETLVGKDRMHTHAVYFEVWTLRPGERDHPLVVGRGHEQVCYVVSGEVEFRGDGQMFRLKAGQAVHLLETDRFQLSNLADGPAELALGGGHTAEAAMHHLAEAEARQRRPNDAPAR